MHEYRNAVITQTKFENRPVKQRKEIATRQRELHFSVDGIHVNKQIRYNSV